MSQAVLLLPRVLSLRDDALGVGDDARMILRQWREVTEHYQRPATRQPRRIDQRFSELAAIWKQERGPISSVAKMVMHPAYQQIIGMGPAVVPCLLRELEREPDHWFWALKAITGIDPVPPESRGKLQAMASAWIGWGREQGYQW